MPGAQSAPPQIPRDYRPCHAALLNWQVMGPQPELHQSPELGKRDGKLKIGLCRHLAWPSKPAQIRARFPELTLSSVAYGCEIWGTLCVGNIVPELRKMAEVQLAFYRQTMRLKKAVPAHLILAELDEVPWVGSWWSQILGFLQKLGNLAGDALHAEILRDNMHDARMDPLCGNWAAGVDKVYSSLGMQSPFLGLTGVSVVDPHTFRRNMGDAQKRN